MVSIIVPMYNVEKYIKKTIESLINQDYPDIEIILVDDGSPDKSGMIAEDFAAKDSRIIVIHQMNKGVSSARNAGLNVAKGEYVTFVDGDDWVDSDYVSYFFSMTQKGQYDIAMNLRNYEDENGRSSNAMMVVNAETAMEWIYLGHIFVAVWNKMYRTDFLRKNRVRFDEKIWYGEGMLFNIDCLQFTSQVIIGDKCVYHQVSNPESAMRKFNLESNLCGIKSLELQKEHWRKTNKEIENAWKYHRRAFNKTIINGIVRCNLENKYKSEYEQCAKNLRRNLMDSLRVCIPFKEKLLYICYAISPYFMAKRESIKSKLGGGQSNLIIPVYYSISTYGMGGMLA